MNQTADTPEREAERRQLDHTLERIEANLEELEKRLAAYAEDIQAQKEYLWTSRDEMDHIEKISARESIEQAVMTGDNALVRRHKLEKLRNSPYFGRFDFARGASAEPIYIGIHHFHDDLAGVSRVHDWRAPIASLFYDYETGPATYESPEGPVGGEITRKRQFRIKGGEIELMIDSEVHVVDEPPASANRHCISPESRETGVVDRRNLPGSRWSVSAGCPDTGHGEAHTPQRSAACPRPASDTAPECR